MREFSMLSHRSRMIAARSENSGLMTSVMEKFLGGSSE
jgi:hypothetical protein